MQKKKAVKTRDGTGFVEDSFAAAEDVLTSTRVLNMLNIVIWYALYLHS